jgi:hypothetical protein
MHANIHNRIVYDRQDIRIIHGTQQQTMHKVSTVV